MKALRAVLALLLLVCLGLDEPTANGAVMPHGITRHYLNGPHGWTRVTQYDEGTITAGGQGVYYGELAADASIPFGAQMVIPTIGTFRVEDRGGLVAGAHVDVYVPYVGYHPPRRPPIPDWVAGVYWY